MLSHYYVYHPPSSRNFAWYGNQGDYTISKEERRLRKFWNLRNRYIIQYIKQIRKFVSVRTFARVILRIWISLAHPRVRLQLIFNFGPPHPASPGGSQVLGVGWRHAHIALGFPAKRWCNFGENAPKMDFVAKITLRGLFLVNKTLVAMVTNVVAMVTIMVAMETKVVAMVTKTVA